MMRCVFDTNASERERFLGLLLRDAQLVEITESIRACRDPKDDQVLELAVCGRADWIITGDADLLVLDPFRGIRIVTPTNTLGLAPPRDPARLRSVQVVSGSMTAPVLRDLRSELNRRRIGAQLTAMRQLPGASCEASALTGSTSAASCARIQQATIATAKMPVAAPPSVSGSVPATRPR